MLTSVLSLDYYLTQLINSMFPHSRFFNLFFSFFSQNGSSIFIWIALGIFILIFEERKNPGISKKDKRFIIIFILALLTQFIFVDVVLKNVFMRPRPQLISTNFNRFQPISTTCPHDYSFPSGHAATAFCAAAILTAFDKKRKYLYYFIAFLIALSRIYLNCHYLGDVLVGGAIGWLTAWFFLQLAKLPIVFEK